MPNAPLSHIIKTHLGEDAYLVWSHEHGAWWRPKRAGYTTHHDHAGFYTREEALAICAQARGGMQPGKPPSEIPVRVADIIDVVLIGAGKEPVGGGA
jgi:hypothetical protein